MKQYNKSRKS